MMDTDDWETLKYYKNDTLWVFDSYEAHKNSNIRYKESKETLNKHYITNKTSGEGYNRINITHQGKRHTLNVSICIVSTFLGPPPDDGKKYTADHIDSEDKKNDALDNLRWADPPTQRNNQRKSERDFNKIAICRTDSVGNTVEYNGLRDAAEQNGKSMRSVHKWLNGSPCVRLKDEFGKQYVWSYKDEPEDLPGEVWHETISDSKVFASQFGRIKDERKTSITKRYPKEYISSMTTLTHPVLSIKGKVYTIHYLVYIAWFPFSGDYGEYDYKLCHMNDDKDDCSVYNLRLGTRTQNGTDAHNNGSYDGTKCERRPIVAIHKKSGKRIEFSSNSEATRFLGKDTAKANIWSVLNNKNNKKTAYGYTWEYL
jgi:hypothetical protein